MSIGKRIREARINMGLTQKQLAEKIGVTTGAVTNYENGVSHPKEEVLYKLFEALNCDANFLFQDEFFIETIKNDPLFKEPFDEQIKFMIPKIRMLDNENEEALRKYLDLLLLKQDKENKK